MNALPGSFRFRERCVSDKRRDVHAGPLGRFSDGLPLGFGEQDRKAHGAALLGGKGWASSSDHAVKVASFYVLDNLTSQAHTKCMTTTQPTRPNTAIFFETSRKGQRLAYRWSPMQLRSFRVSLATAELSIAQGLAFEIPSNPMKP